VEGPKDSAATVTATRGQGFHGGAIKIKIVRTITNGRVLYIYDTIYSDPAAPGFCVQPGPAT